MDESRSFMERKMCKMLWEIVTSLIEFGTYCAVGIDLILRIVYNTPLKFKTIDMEYGFLDLIGQSNISATA